MNKQAVVYKGQLWDFMPIVILKTYLIYPTGNLVDPRKELTAFLLHKDNSLWWGTSKSRFQTFSNKLQSVSTSVYFLNAVLSSDIIYHQDNKWIKHETTIHDK